MQSVLRTIHALWAFIGQSSVMQLFLVSILLLITGLVYEIWKRSIHLTYLNDVSLQNVEFTHPHLPSTKIISAIAVTMGLMYAVILYIQASGSIFQNPSVWIVSAASFLLAGSIAIIGELHWKVAHEYVFSVILGTIITLAILGMRSIYVGDWQYQNLVLAIVLLVCGIAARRLIGKTWTDFGKLLSIITFILLMGILW